MTTQPSGAITAAVAAPSPPATVFNPSHHFVSIKLDSRNYLYWRTQVLPFLRSQNLVGYVDGTFPCPPETIVVDSANPATPPTLVPNPAYLPWIQQDQGILSLIVSSLTTEVMYLAVGKETSQAVWESINSAFASTSRSRCLSLLGQFQAMRQGNLTPAEYLGHAQVLVEALSLAGHPLSADSQILYVLKGLRPEYRAMASSLTTPGTPVTLPQLADHLRAQEFIQSDDFAAADSVTSSTSQHIYNMCNPTISLGF